MGKNDSTLGLQIIRLKMVLDTFGCYIAIYQSTVLAVYYNLHSKHFHYSYCDNMYNSCII